MEKFAIIILVMLTGMKELCEGCIESERNGLLQIKSSWGTSDPDCCTWEGVQCDDETGHVTSLDLYSSMTDFDSEDSLYLNASLFLPFPRLKLLDLGYNNIAGCVPNEENIEITMKGHTYMYEYKVLRYVSGIDVSNNYMTGQIPIEIGDLRGIKALNLSKNCFTGTIPSTFSNLKEIESLDLSYNNLQGTIPPQLTQLTSLTAFNVSYNNLSGKTPNQAKQFATFDESSYRGNPFLCGWPLSKSCGTLDSTQSQATTDERNNELIDMDDFFVSFGVAYAMVLLTLVAVLCVNPYWRRVWFYYIQLSIDRTYYFIIDNVIPLRSMF